MLRRLLHTTPPRRRHSSFMPRADGGPTASVAAAPTPTGLAVLTLNRPSKLNALDTASVEALLGGVRGVLAPVGAGAGGAPAPGAAARALLLQGAPTAHRPALCAGGDVRAIREAVLEAPVTGGGPWPAPGPRHAARRVFQAEYTLLSELAAAPAPAVVVMDGVVMGLGAGLAAAAGAGAGAVRVATERTLFAMPETAIGLFPDVGFALWGQRGLSARAVLALGLGGGRVSGGAAAVRAGLATHALPSAALPSFVAAVRALDLRALPSPAAVKAALTDFADAAVAAAAPLPPAPPDDGCLVAAADDAGRLAPALDALLAWRDAAPSAPPGRRAATALAAFEAAVAAAAAGGDPAAAGLATGLAAAAPVGAAVWLRLVSDAAARVAAARADPAAALAAQLAAELPPAARLAASPVFEAGVRAVLIDKAPPVWPPAAAAPDDAVLDALLAPLSDGGLDGAYYLCGEEDERRAAGR